MRGRQADHPGPMPQLPDDMSASIIPLYERHAQAYDRDRARSLQERAWLDSFLAAVPPSGTVLDLGCGMGEPIAAYCLAAGFRILGVDSSPSLIGLARSRFPGAEWRVGDMRQLDLGRYCDGILAWDSFFHLSPDDQRAMFARFARHARSGAPLLFTSGTAEGEAIGSYRGEPLYHASLGAPEYRRLLTANGYTVVRHLQHDPQCGGHTVWLATYGGAGHTSPVAGNVGHR
jgi:SAM-dependent methyltransferase